VLEKSLLEQVREPLSALRPMTAVFDHEYVRRIDGPNKKPEASKMEHAEMLMDDIRGFRESTGAARLAMIWCGSTEVFHRPAAVHQTLPISSPACRRTIPRFPQPDLRVCRAEDGRSLCQRRAAPDHGYAGAAAVGARTPGAYLRQGFQNRPDVHEDVDCAGTEIAHAGTARLVLDKHPGEPRRRGAGRSGLFQSKEETKMEALQQILQATCIRIFTKTSITRCASTITRRGATPRKAGITSISSAAGLPDAIKIDFLCRDSILAAPLVLDLVLFSDLAQRAGMRGIQEWLSFYFKAPMHAPELYPEHDIFIQLMKLKNTLRWMRGEDLITHLGLEYYD